MKHTLSTKSLFLLAALLLLLPVQAAAQDRPQTALKSNPRQVFAELIKPYRNMRDYTVKIQAKVVMPNIRIPDYTAVLYFKKPDKFHIKTKNFAPIPRGNAIFNPFQFDPDKNQITFKQMETLNGAPAALYKVEPGEEEKRIRFYNVWVGGNPKRILQVESHTVKGTKALIRLSYRQTGQGTDKWLLPDKVYAHLTFPEAVNGPENLTVKDSPLSSGSARIESMTGEGNITIFYSEWQVNTGLDDQLFKDK